MNPPLKENHERFGEYNKEIRFFTSDTNKKLAILSKNENIQKNAGNSLAHLSFRSSGIFSKLNAPPFKNKIRGQVYF